MRWALNDSSRAEMPLSEERDDTFPCGIAINLNSTLTINEGDLVFYDFLLYFVSSRGHEGKNINRLSTMSLEMTQACRLYVLKELVSLKICCLVTTFVAFSHSLLLLNSLPVISKLFHNFIYVVIGIIYGGKDLMFILIS